MERVRQIPAFLFGVFCVLACQWAPARASLDYLPRLAPTSGWMVGQAVVAESADPASDMRGLPLPCVAMNQFENGFTVRLSGGGKRVVAMAFDFRQNAFGHGERYPIRLSVDRLYAHDFEGVAFDAGTLVVDTGGDEKLFQALGSGEILIVGMGGNVVAFDLKGLPDGLARLESCHRPQATPSPATSQTVMATPPLPPVQPAQQPETPPVQAPLKIDAALKLADDSIAGIPMQGSMSPDLPPVTADGPPAPAQPPVWTATAHEAARNVLERWAAAAGVRLQWTASHNGSSDRDFRYEGSLEDAVQAYLAQTDKSMTATWAGQRSASPAPSSISKVPFENGSRTGPWVAAKGADLRDTLALWSRQAGVDLVWRSPVTFSIPMDIRFENSYEGAVGKLLEQSSSGTLRPIGELHRDPGSGQTALVIRVEGKT